MEDSSRGAEEVLGVIFIIIFLLAAGFSLGMIAGARSSREIELKDKACAWIYENEPYDTYIYYCK